MPAVGALQQLALGRDDVADGGGRRPRGEAQRRREARRALQHADPGRHGRQRPGLPAVGAQRDRALARGRRWSARTRRTRHEPPADAREIVAGQEERGEARPLAASVCPKSVLWADHISVPLLTMAVQSAESGAATLVDREGAGRRRWPAPSRAAVGVVTTTPLPGSDAPFEPTAMQSVAVGQETPLSCGVLPPATCCALHATPPLVVATITVVPAAAGAGLGPATPTAQQRRALAQDTAPSSPVPAGAGWPDHERRASRLTEDTRRRGRSRVPGQRTARRGDRHRGEQEGSGRRRVAGHAGVEARSVEARRDDNSGGGRHFLAHRSLPSQRWTGWTS